MMEENIKLKDAIVNQQLRITELASQNESLIQVQTLERDKITRELAKDSSETENVALKAEISNLKVQNSSLTQASDEIKTKYSDLESQISMLFQAADCMDKKHSNLESENKCIKAQLIKTNILLACHVLRGVDLQSQMSSLKTTNRQLNRKCAVFKHENESLENELARVRVDLDIEKEELKLNQDQVSSLTTNNTELDQKYTQLDTDYQSIKEKLKDKEHELELQTLKLQQREDEAKLFPNAKIMYDQSKLFMERCGDFANFYNQNKEKLDGAMNNIGVDLKQLEAENTLVQTVANLPPEAKKALSLDIEGDYDLISSINFEKYIKAAGLLIDQSRNSPIITNNKTDAHVTKFGSSEYYIWTSFYYGSKYVYVGYIFDLGIIFEGKLEGVSSDILCKTLVTKESETTLLQQQVYKGQIWVTRREFTPTHMTATLSAPRRDEGAEEEEGITCSLVFKKRDLIRKETIKQEVIEEDACIIID